MGPSGGEENLGGGRQRVSWVDIQEIKHGAACEWKEDDP